MDGQPFLTLPAVAELTGKHVEWDETRGFVVIDDVPSPHMTHAVYQHPTSLPVPSVSLAAFHDSKAQDSYNIHIATTNWTWAPERINEGVVPNEGHAHLYLDGVLVTRIYGPWYQLRELTPGPHDLRITLNVNDHSDYTTGPGQVVEASTMVVVPMLQRPSSGDQHP
jgi:hypothetical protein